ncbi:MAG TPA: hypothetical protein VF715_13840 [Thermoleophilaceae bacterium]|jgi:hypothetical protein
MNAFHVIGGLLAAWAVIVALLGFRGFPRNEGGVRAVMAITVLLVAGAIGSAIGTSEKHGAHDAGHGDRANPTHGGESPENAPDE